MYHRIDRYLIGVSKGGLTSFGWSQPDRFLNKAVQKWQTFSSFAEFDVFRTFNLFTQRFDIVRMKAQVIYGVS